MNNNERFAASHFNVAYRRGKAAFERGDTKTFEEKRKFLARFAERYERRGNTSLVLAAEDYYNRLSELKVS